MPARRQTLRTALRRGRRLRRPDLGRPELITADDILSFVGIEPPTLRLYPVETHVAETLHAYTMPRARPNLRVKDLPDLALLGTIGVLEANRLAEALEQTFTFRKTHALPASLPDPNPAWETPYAAMARADQLAWPTLADVTAASKAFLNPILAGSGNRDGNQCLGAGADSLVRAVRLNPRVSARNQNNRTQCPNRSGS